MRIENHDFFVYSPDSTSQNISESETKSFFENYSYFIKKNYHIPDKSLMVCPISEAKELDGLVGVQVTSPKLSKRRDSDDCEAELCVIPNEINIIEPRVTTISADDKHAVVQFSCKTNEKCKINIYMAPSWPTKSDEELVCSLDWDKNFSAEIELNNVNLWSAETPELYDIRFEAVNGQGVAYDDTVVETGFRKIARCADGLYINGKRAIIKGANASQHFIKNGTKYLPESMEIVWQYLMLKRMQGNTLKLSITDESNITKMARLADRLGVMLFWDNKIKTTLFHNHPSIVIFEGGVNEIPKEEKEKLQIWENFGAEGEEDCRTKEALESEVANNENWRYSQAKQAVLLSQKIKSCRISNNDGLILDGLFGVEKTAVIDRYGYSKYSYHITKENYKTITCVNDDCSIKRGKGFTVKPVLFAPKGDCHTVTVAIIDIDGNPVGIKTYGEVICVGNITRLPEWKPNIEKAGYYAVKTIVI